MNPRWPSLQGLFDHICTECNSSKDLQSIIFVSHFASLENDKFTKNQILTTSEKKV